MKIKNKNGIEWISCDNLGELVEEFKKIRATQIASGQKKDWNKYHFFQMLKLKVVNFEGKTIATEEIDSAPVYQQDGVDLSLNLAPLRFKEKDWRPYNKKIKEILKEIWETGEVKNYQGLDLSWPAISSRNMCCDQCHKYIGDRKLAYFSNAEKDLDFCSESCHSKLKVNNGLEKENQELKRKIEKGTNHKNVWMIIAIMAISIFVLTLLFSWIKLKKLKKK